MSAAVNSARRTPLASARTPTSPSPRVASARSATIGSARLVPPPPPKVPLLVLSSNQTAVHRSLPVPLKAPPLSQIFAPPSPAKRPSLSRTQAHTNPFQPERQSNSQPSSIRTSIPHPVKHEAVECRKSFVAKATDPLQLHQRPKLSNAAVDRLIAPRPTPSLLLPYATKGCTPVREHVSSRKRVNSAPAGTRSVINPESLPQAGTEHVHRTFPAEKKPSLPGIFIPDKTVRSAYTGLSTPYARNTPRSATPKPSSSVAREVSRPPFSTNTPRAATPPPSRGASRPPYSIGSTPRAAQPATYKVQAPYHSSTPRAATPKSGYKVEAPFA